MTTLCNNCGRNITGRIYCEVCRVAPVERVGEAAADEQSPYFDFSPTGEDLLRMAERLSVHLDGVIEFARNAWKHNDGADGDAVRRICQVAEMVPHLTKEFRSRAVPQAEPAPHPSRRGRPYHAAWCDDCASAAYIWADTRTCRQCGSARTRTADPRENAMRHAWETSEGMLTDESAVPQASAEEREALAAWNSDDPLTPEDEARINSARARVMASIETPVCKRCNDTHRMTLHREGHADQIVSCTGCPTPCDQCRGRAKGGGFTAFCASTPCACACHVRSNAKPETDERVREAEELLDMALRADLESERDAFTRALGEYENKYDARKGTT